MFAPIRIFGFLYSALCLAIGLHLLLSPASIPTFERPGNTFVARGGFEEPPETTGSTPQAGRQPVNVPTPRARRQGTQLEEEIRKQAEEVARLRNEIGLLRAELATVQDHSVKHAEAYVQRILDAANEKIALAQGQLSFYQLLAFWLAVCTTFFIAWGSLIGPVFSLPKLDWQIIRRPPVEVPQRTNPNPD